MATEIRSPIGEMKMPSYTEGRDARLEAEQKYIDTLAGLAKLAASGGALAGKVLRWPRADGYAAYMVWSEKPLKIVHLNMGDAWRVESSLIRGLTLRVVKAMVSHDEALTRLFDDPNRFYNTLEVGDIAHYSNGFAQFVRCKVVEFDPKTMTTRHDIKPGEIALQEIALVGEVGRRQEADGSWVHGWSEYDLPRYSADGSINYGYHAESVINGNIFKPHAGNLWEYPEFQQRAKLLSLGIDPTEMKPIDLDPPEMTIQQKRCLPLVQALHTIRSLTDVRDDDYSAMTVSLTEIYNLLKGVTFD